MEDFTRQQMNRGALLASVLDVYLSEWIIKLTDPVIQSEVPKELEDHLVNLVESLDNQRKAAASLPEGADEFDSPQYLDARGDYLQALASLSDDALMWVAKTFSTLPETLMGE